MLISTVISEGKLGHGEVLQDATIKLSLNHRPCDEVSIYLQLFQAGSWFADRMIS